MKKAWMIIVALCGLNFLGGCQDQEKPYGRETAVFLPGTRAQTWAVAPAVNLSGEKQVDPLLQADLVYQQLQQVKGLAVIPVNRVAEVYASLQIPGVQSEEQANIVCEVLGCDGLIVPTVTAFDPYNPPKFGAALQWFARGTTKHAQNVDPRLLIRAAAPQENTTLSSTSGFAQVVGMYDASNGSVREKLLEYADGRHDPNGPLASKEYFVSMDRYCGFVYHDLVVKLLERWQGTQEPIATLQQQ